MLLNFRRGDILIFGMIVIMLNKCRHKQYNIPSISNMWGAETKSIQCEQVANQETLSLEQVKLGNRVAKQQNTSHIDDIAGWLLPPLLLLLESSLNCEQIDSGNAGLSSTHLQFHCVRWDAWILCAFYLREIEIGDRAII